MRTSLVLSLVLSLLLLPVLALAESESELEPAPADEPAPDDAPLAGDPEGVPPSESEAVAPAPVQRAVPCAHPAENRWLSRRALTEAVAFCDDAERRSKVLKRGYLGASSRMAPWLDQVRLADQLLNGGGTATDSWRSLLEVAGGPTSTRKRVRQTLAELSGLSTSEIKEKRAEIARKPGPLMAHPALRDDADGFVRALLSPDSAREVWGVLQAAAKEAENKREPWPQAQAELLDRLAYAMLAVGWSGGLRDRATRERLADAFLGALPEPKPRAIVRDVLGEQQAAPALAALKYRPERGSDFEPPMIPGMGILVVYRPGGFAGSAIPVPASLGREIVGVMTPGTYTWLYLPPGEYTIEAKTEAKSEHDFEVREGEIVQVRA